MRNNKKGFTLVEILTVVALIAILFVIFIPRIDFATTKTREVGVETDFRGYELAFEEVAKLKAGFHADNKTIGDADNATTISTTTLKTNLEDSLNSFLDNAMDVTISSVDTNGNVTGIAKTKVDPWNTLYYIYGRITTNGDKSWMQVVSYGPNKTEEATGDYARRTSDANDVFGVDANLTLPPRSTSEKQVDDYSLTVYYSPTGIQMQSTGFDNNINAK